MVKELYFSLLVFLELYYREVSNPEYAFTYLVQRIFPQGFDIIFLLAVLSASMSTLTAIMGTMTHILRDVVGLKKVFSSRNEFLFYRIVTVTIALTTTVMALQPPHMIIVLFGVTTSILSGVLIGPIVYGLFWRRTSAIAVSAYGEFKFPWTYYAFGPTILLSLLTPPLVSLVTKPPSREVIDRVFSKC